MKLDAVLETQTSGKSYSFPFVYNYHSYITDSHSTDVEMHDGEPRHSRGESTCSRRDASTGAASTPAQSAEADNGDGEEMAKTGEQGDGEFVVSLMTLSNNSCLCREVPMEVEADKPAEPSELSGK